MRALSWLAAVGLGALAALTPPAPAAAVPIAGTGPVIVLRPGHAVLTRPGSVRRFVPLPWGPVSFPTLVEAIDDPSWMSLSAQGELHLKAGISQRPGTELRVRQPVRMVRLHDAYLSGTRARVWFEGVTVTSAPESVRRPFVRYLNGSTLTATGTTFEGLGSAYTRERGVSVGAGGRLTAVDTTFRGSNRGLDVYRAARVTLTRVSAIGNAEAGIVLNQARAVHFTDVTANDNAGTGLVLRGPLAPELTRVTSARNRTGVELSALGAAPLGPLTTENNRHSGVVLDRCAGCVLSGVRSSGDHTGVLVERQSAGAEVRDGAVHGAGRLGVAVAADRVRLRGLTVQSPAWGVGLRVLPRVQGVAIESSAVTGGAVGVSTDGAGTTVSGVSVTDARIGLRIGRDAENTAVTAVRMSGTETGLQANAGARGVAVRQLQIAQRGGQGIRSAAQNMSVDDTTVQGARHGMHLKGVATVRASTVSGADEAVVAGPRGQLMFVGGALHGESLGLRVSPSSSVILQDTTVDAPQGARGPVQLRGSSTLPAMPVRWIGVFGLVVIAAAIALEVVRRLRERRTDRAVSAPSHVTNIA
ncbi:right-handed parallel beta-helix repeat-containing protein [Actinomycetes bacterium KLBMP 9797]